MIVYHFAIANKENQPVLRKGGIVLKPGLALRMRGPIIPCRRGFHGSVRAIDALGYANGAWLNMREFPDDAIPHDGDKHVSLWMRVLSVRNVSRQLHEFACREAEIALTTAGVTNECSWAVIAAKRAWLEGEINDNELDAARDAAWDAAWDTARGAAWDTARGAARAATRAAAWAAAWEAARGAARDAARAAAWAATRGAAWDTAWDTAWAAAWDAAWDAAMDASNKRLEALLRLEAESD